MQYDGRTAVEGAVLRNQLRVVREGKLLVALALCLTLAGGILASVRQERLYHTSAEVLIGRQDMAAELAGVSDSRAGEDPERLIQTQTAIARTPEVARRALQLAGVHSLSPIELLERSTVEPRPTADVLVFGVRHGSAAIARRLATAYARAYAAFRLDLDSGSLRRAQVELEETLDQLRGESQRGSPLFATLIEKNQLLKTLAALQTSNALVIRPADDVRLVQPRLLRNALLALVLGLVVGVAAAFLRHALDPRLFSEEEVGHELGLQRLGTVATPPRRFARPGRIAMLSEPFGIHSESFRMLRTSVEFANADVGARSILVTGATSGEGKSTTVANLALAASRAGRHVVLVDLDLRRPSLHELFGVPNADGVSEVIRGRSTVAEALVPVFGGHTEGYARSENGVMSTTEGAGSLELLTAGAPLPDAAEFVGGRSIALLLSMLRERADLVLVDAPPLLQVSDALRLSAFVDAVVAVVRFDQASRPRLREMRRALESMPAAKLGFVLTGHELSAYGGYGYAYAPAQADERPLVAG